MLSEVIVGKIIIVKIMVVVVILKLFFEIWLWINGMIIFSLMNL